jgi:hypothetical protein
MKGLRSHSFGWSGLKVYSRPTVALNCVPLPTAGLSRTPLDQCVKPAPASSCHYWNKR